MDEPEGDKALALHRMNVLRELRGGLHGASVLAEGMAPVEALSVKTPFMAALFGWDELPDPDQVRDAWARAEESTNKAVARVLAALSPAERAELVGLLEQASATG